MAEAIPRSEWLEAEESVSRDIYWQYLMDQYLWQAPFAVPPRPIQHAASGRGAPSVEDLQDNGWVMVPESQISH